MLEEMDVLFGGVNHVEKGGAQMGLEDTHHAHVEHGGMEMNDDIAPAGQGNNQVVVMGGKE